MEGTFSVTRKLLILERETGFEPATSSLGSWHSTTELLPRSFNINDFRTAFLSEHQTNTVIVSAIAAQVD
jgi:hypothetical protein